MPVRVSKWPEWMVFRASVGGGEVKHISHGMPVVGVRWNGQGDSSFLQCHIVSGSSISSLGDFQATVPWNLLEEVLPTNKSVNHDSGRHGIQQAGAPKSAPGKGMFLESPRRGSSFAVLAKLSIKSREEPVHCDVEG